jgi:hypothetical protein
MQVIYGTAYYCSIVLRNIKQQIVPCLRENWENEGTQRHADAKNNQ